MQAKILIGTNILTSVDSAIYANHINFYCQLARNRDIKLIHCAPGRMSIDRMRNMCAKVALEHECTHVLFIDDDVMIQPGTVESLLDTDLDIVMANTYIRGYPFHAMSFKRQNNENGMYNITYFDDILEKGNSENGVARCEAVGFSCCLIKTWLLKEIEEPWFVTTPNGTEDIYFCMKCRNDIQGNELGDGKFEGKEVKVGVDLRVPTGHLMEREPISMFNRKILSEIHERCQAEQTSKGSEETVNRADNYLAEIEKLTKVVAPTETPVCQN